ncbi:MAG: YheU family protein [Gammaproteobacteria bacterium]|nr:YheU family protein [Gammaproteobacteria bacterium]
MTSSDSEPDEDPVEIPFRELSAGALQGVVEAFVLREGTDYGAYEIALADKVAQVLLQLERGEARVMFDPKSSSIDIVTRAKARKSPDE